jgi:TRAP-type C4-dicarboxylate transport system permease small subunit
MLKNIDRIITTLIRGISFISGFCLLGIMFTAFFNVLGEKIFTSGIPMSKEIIQYLHIPVVFLSMGYVTLDRGQVKIDLISSRFPKGAQNFCALLGDVLGIAVSGFISYRGFVQTIRFYDRHQMSTVSGLGFPLWPVALLMSLGFIVLAFSFFWNIIRRFTGLGGNQ